MADDKFNNDFSFDNDPGKMNEVDDVDFTFSDIPVLGVEKDKKDSFSFDQLPEGEDASIASFEALLQETPDDSDEDAQSCTTIGIDRVKSDRKAKEKKKLIKKFIIAGIAVVVLLIITGGVYLILANVAAKAKEKVAQLTPEQKRELKIKLLKEEIAKILVNGEKKLKAGKTQESLETYESVLKLDSTNPIALTGIARCYQSLGDHKKVQEYYKLALEDKRVDAKPFAALANILNKEKNLNPVIELLQKGVVKFPEEKTLLIPLADAYYASGDENEALEVYKKIPKASLQKKSLKSYAKLMKFESKNDAKKLFVYIANKFRDFDAYCSAANLSSDNAAKIQILGDSVAALKESSNLDNAKFMLATVLVDNGDKVKALELINGINVKKLDVMYCESLLEVAQKASDKNIDIKVLSEKLLSGHPKDLLLLIKIQQQLLELYGASEVLNIFGEWWNKNKNNAIANYLYGKAFGSSSYGKKYFKKAVAINPKLYQANMELGKIAMYEKDWKEAEKAFLACFKSPKFSNKAHGYYALARLKSGKRSVAIDEYSAFLDTKGVTLSAKAVKLIPLALLLPSSNRAETYLSIIKLDPALRNDYKEFVAKKELMFGGDDSAIFAGKKEGAFREYCILYMLSKGKSREILLMPTPPKEFPEFWKVFIAREKNLKIWKKGAEILYEKNKNSSNFTLKTILRLWLGKITIKEAEKKFSRIPFEKEALFYLILAEEYKRKKMKTKAKMKFLRAKKLDRNIYSSVVDYYSKRL